MNNIAVIILNYNTWHDTLNEIEMVHSICNIEYKDIIVIDNASQNESAEELKANSFRGYTFILSEKNSGYAAGNNIGLRYAKKQKYQYAWILNNDIIIKDSTILESMINVMENDKCVATVNTDIYSPEGYMFNRDAKRPTIWDFTLGMLAYRKKGRQITINQNYGYIYRPQGCSMLLDLEKLHNVNYLDENTFLYCEEIILAEKLLSSGYKCACCINKKVVHNHSKTVKSTFAKKEVRKMQNSSFDYYLYRYRSYNIVLRKICILFNTIKLIILDF